MRPGLNLSARPADTYSYFPLGRDPRRVAVLPWLDHNIACGGILGDFWGGPRIKRALGKIGKPNALGFGPCPRPYPAPSPFRAPGPAALRHSRRRMKRIFQPARQLPATVPEI